MGANVSEENIASIFTLYTKMEAVCSSETLVPTYQIIRCHNPECYNMNHHLSGNLGFHVDQDNVQWLSSLLRDEPNIWTPPP
jgi:hypothetical protein